MRCWSRRSAIGLASRRQALDELMRKLLVVHRLLEAEERLAKREPPTEPT
jgi:hypothetical protein